MICGNANCDGCSCHLGHPPCSHCTDHMNRCEECDEPLESGEKYIHERCKTTTCAHEFRVYFGLKQVDKYCTKCGFKEEL